MCCYLCFWSLKRSGSVQISHKWPRGDFHETSDDVQRERSGSSLLQERLHIPPFRPYVGIFIALFYSLSHSSDVSLSFALTAFLNISFFPNLSLPNSVGTLFLTTVIIPYVLLTLVCPQQPCHTIINVTLSTLTSRADHFMPLTTTCAMRLIIEVVHCANQ